MINGALGTRKVVALIPARAGSKGVLDKNMRLLNGIPLIGHTIEAARAASYIDDVFVSSDGDDILRYSGSMGVVSIKRPDEYSSDEASAVDVVKHFMMCKEYTSRYIKEDPVIVYLQPTSPLRSQKHIDEVLDAVNSRGDNYRSISVKKSPTSPFKMFLIDSEGTLSSVLNESMTNYRRQDLPDAFIPNGAIYTFTQSDFEAHGGFPSNGSLPFVMSEIESIDIDTLSDFELAERVLNGH